MQALLEAGAHFGHQTHRWNPKMKPYIFGERNGVHIIDLSQSVPLFARALDFVRQTVAAGGKVLFVGTKRQAQDPIAEAARRSGQHFVNHRWLGGMLTNWKTISNSIKRFKSLEEQLSGDTAGLTKKEVLQLTRERDKLELRRNPRDGRPSRRHLRDRREQGGARDQGSQRAWNPGRRHPRFERQPAGHRLPRPGQ
jgi:small subunit ribosomal protein S2